ncbi:amidohydrolase [Streptomyces sp. NPDC051286]|uniref:amidohydrolase n=1 Tax=Streptomyces sp. NPDC051286 TaxID=3365647 RepID=UPI00379BAF39
MTHVGQRSSRIHSRFRRRAIAVVAALALPLGITGAASAFPAPQSGAGHADTFFVNGKVLQYGPNQAKFSDALAVKDGKIVFVGVGTPGQTKKWVGPNTKVVNLKGKTLMPSLGDGHLHGAEIIDCDMGYEGGTVNVVLGRLKACLTSAEQAGHLKSNYILSAFNFMGDAMQPKGTVLDRATLDRLSKSPEEDPYGTGTTRPIVVFNMDGHKFATNSQAIINAGITADTPTPPGGFIGHDKNGEPNGTFADFSADFGPATPQPPDADYQQLVANIKKANRLGVTSVLRPAGSETDVQLAKRLADDGNMTVHFNQALTASDVRGASEAKINEVIARINKVRNEFDGYSSPNSPGSLSIDTVKIFCDGVPEYPGQTAAMEKPYRINVGTTENPVWVEGDRRGEEPSCDDARRGFLKLDANKWTIHTHSIGNRAVRVSLDNYAAIKKTNPAWDRRDTITHLQFVNKSDYKRFGEIGVVASMSLQWAQRDGWTINGAEGYIAPEDLAGMYPTKSLLRNGAVVAAGSDWPVTDLIPWTAIETAIDREGEVNEAAGILPGQLVPTEGISLFESLKAATIGVAYQMHQDDVTGSIEVGKLADLIVIDQDLFSIPTEKISDTKVLMTMINGKVVYSDPNAPVL